MNKIKSWKYLCSAIIGGITILVSTYPTFTSAINIYSYETSKNKISKGYLQKLDYRNVNFKNPVISPTYSDVKNVGFNSLFNKESVPEYLTYDVSKKRLQANYLDSWSSRFGWSNHQRSGPPGKVFGNTVGTIHNYVSFKEVGLDSRLLQSFENPGFSYKGKVRYNGSIFNQADCFSFNKTNFILLNNNLISIPISMIKISAWDVGAYNFTNNIYPKIWFGNGSSATQTIDGGGYGTSLFTDYDGVLGQGDVRAMGGLSGIMSSPDLTSDKLNWYFPAADTSLSMQYSPISNISHKLASEYLKKITNEKGALIDVTSSNAVPATHYGFRLSAFADNLTGTIKIEVTPGPQVSKKQVSGFSVFDMGNTMRTTIEITGFKKVTPTGILGTYDVKNLFFQPQYVSEEEIRNIIFENMITGSVPENFNKRNIVFLNIERNNLYGNIKAEITLNLFYDRLGDIQTSGADSVTVQINGFVATNYTSFPSIIPIKSDKLASDISVPEIQQIIFDFIEKDIYVPGTTPDKGYFTIPPGFKKENILIDKYNITYNNISGFIRFSPRINSYYDEFGIINTSPKTIPSITIKGFKTVQPTIIVSDLGQIPNSNNDRYASDFVNNLLMAKIYIKSLMPSSMIPPLFNESTDILLSNILADNLSGTFSATVAFNNYFDSNGFIRQSGFEPVDIIITGFTNTIPTVSLPRINMKDSSRLPSSITEEQIKEIILKNYQGLAPKTSTKNIKFLTPPIWTNQSGKIEVIPTLNRWVDRDGIIKTNQKTFEKLTIFGLNNSTQTTIDHEKLYLPEMADNFAQDFFTNKNNIKSIILNAIVNPTITFSLDNIILSNLSFDNAQGTISGEVTLNNYYDADGNPQTTGFVAEEFIIKDFKIMNTPTSILKQIIGPSDVLPQFFTQQKIKEILLENIESKPKTFGIENIKLENINFFNTIGLITFDVTLNLWYDYDNIIQTTNKIFPEISINQMKFIAPTAVDENKLNVDIPNIMASEYSEYYENLVTLVKGALINTPDSLTNNDIILSNIVHNDLDGTITLDLVLNNYYNELGILTTNNFVPKKLTFRGFDSITGGTYIDESIKLGDEVSDIFAGDVSTIFPFSVTKTQVRELILRNIKNKTPYFNINNISLLNGFIFNNLGGSGEISTTPVIDSWYDDNGVIQLKSKSLGKITFSGFLASPGQTSIVEGDWNNGDINLLPSNAVKDINKIKKIIFDTNKIINKTPKFNMITDMQLTDLVPNNIDGSISFSISLKTIFNQFGTIETGNFDFGTRTIKGYKQTLGFTNLPVRIKSDESDTYPSDIDEEKIRDIIFSNVSNAPSELKKENVRIKNNSIIRNNKTGTITVTPLLDWWYDVYGNLMNITKEFDPLTIFSYKTANQTLISNTTLSATGTILDGLYPNYVGDNLELIKKFTMSLITNKPLGFNESNIDVSFIESNNYVGSLQFNVSLNYYFDEDGIIKYFNFKPITINVLDMEYVLGVTSILSNINYKGDTPILPSELSDSVIKNIIFENIFSKPEGFTVKDISLKTSPEKNNLNGTVTAIPILAKSYNSDSNLVSTPVEFNAIKIVNLSTTLPTTISSNDLLYSTLNNNILPSELSTKPNEIKNIIFKNLSSYPLAFEKDIYTNISIGNIYYNNLIGVLYLDYKLSNYYDASGNIQTTNINFPTQSIRITNMQKNDATTIVSDVLVNNTSGTLPSNYSEEEITNYIRTNISLISQNLPTNFSEIDDLSIEIIDRNNLLGNIEIKIILTNYFDESGNVQTTPKVFDLLLKGFLVVQPTTIKDEYELIDQGENTAQFIATNLVLLKELLWNNIEWLTNNLPNNLSPNDVDINSQSVKNYDNKLGNIQLTINLNKYYNANGNFIDTSIQKDQLPLNKTILISGFKKEIKTDILSEFTLTNYSDIIPSNVNDAQLLEIINRNKTSIFSSLPSINSLDNNLEVQILEVNNKKGEIRAMISIYEYFDENGNKVTKLDQSPLSNIITFKGFNTVLKTTISKVLFLEDQSDNLASKTTVNSLNQLLFPKLPYLINNAPVGLNMNDFSFEILNTSNATGELFLKVSLKYYNNDLGNVIRTTNQNNYLTELVTLKGFKNAKTTLIKPIVELNSVSSIIPSSVNDDEMKKLILSNKEVFFKNLPPTFIDSNLEVSILEKNDKRGSVTVFIHISNYYDNDENIVFQDKLSSLCVIKGFNNRFTQLGSDEETLITVGVVAGVMSIIGVSILIVLFKFNRRKII